MLIKNDPTIIQSYFEDHSGLLGGYAKAVYLPEKESDIIPFIKEASVHQTPVTIAGAGTGVTGGRVPFGGVVLSLELLQTIHPIEILSDTHARVRLQGGVTVADLKKYAAQQGWMYAPDPTEQTSYIGGTVSTNASGSRGYRYGATRKYISGLRIILSTGEILDLQRGKIRADKAGTFVIPLGSRTLTLARPIYTLPKIKNAAGYFNEPEMDLIDLFIGSEGTLGIITEIEVDLIPRLQKTFSGVAFFPNDDEAFEFVFDAKKDIPDVLSLEYFDRYSLALLKPDYPHIPAMATAAVFFEQDLTNQKEDTIVESLAQLLEKHKAPHDTVWFATSDKDQESFRDFRHALPEKVNEIIRKNKLPKVGTDIAVPDSRCRELLGFIHLTLKNSGIEHLVFGHIGESHLHANFLPKTKEEFTRCRNIYKKIVEHAIQWGGTVSAEHGIGKLKHIFLEQMVGVNGLREMAQIKKTIDPACIFGLDNIIPKEILLP